MGAGSVKGAQIQRWVGTVGNIRTDDGLLRALQEAASRGMSSHEMREQRLSFIMSLMKDGSGVTRDRIKAVLDKLEGQPVSDPV